MNENKNFYYYYYEDIIKECNSFITGNLFDFKLENSDGSNGYNYEYKFPIITFLNGDIKIRANSLILNYGESYINMASLNEKLLIQAKSYSQAYFDINHFLYYFTYNNISDFISGYANPILILAVGKPIYPVLIQFQ